MLQRRRRQAGNAETGVVLAHQQRFLGAQRLAGSTRSPGHVDQRERPQRMAHRFPHLRAGAHERLVAGAGGAGQHPDERAEKATTGRTAIALLAEHV